MDILDKIEGLEAKFHEVSLLITDPSVIADQARYVRLNRDYHDLERVLECAHRYKKAVTDLQDAKDLFYNETDAEMKEMAKAEKRWQRRRSMNLNRRSRSSKKS